MNAHLSMMDVIRAGATKDKTCPWCNSYPNHARQVGNRYLVGCESDTCSANPQVGGDTLAEAWSRWNRRSV